MSGHRIISGPLTRLAFMATIVCLTFQVRGFFLVSLVFAFRRIARS